MKHIVEREEVRIGFWCGNLKERRHLEDPGVANIKMDLQEVGWKGMDWIDLAQDVDRWRAHIYAVMNLQVPNNVGNFLTSSGPISFSGRTAPWS
jgi:hypothetical protein